MTIVKLVSRVKSLWEISVLNVNGTFNDDPTIKYVYTSIEYRYYLLPVSTASSKSSKGTFLEIRDVSVTIVFTNRMTQNKYILSHKLWLNKYWIEQENHLIRYLFSCIWSNVFALTWLISIWKKIFQRPCVTIFAYLIVLIKEQTNLFRCLLTSSFIWERWWWGENIVWLILRSCPYDVYYVHFEIHCVYVCQTKYSSHSQNEISTIQS